MLLEYINYSPDFKPTDLSKFNSKFLESISVFVVPHFYLRSVKNKISATSSKISCLIDFPLGISDTNSRIESIKNAIKTKTDSLDIVMNSSFLANRKYDKIREEISLIKNLCEKNNTDIRYILEYRNFSHTCLKKACSILEEFDLNVLTLSTTYGIDNLSDFIIASKFLSSQNKNLKIILSANFWNEKHIQIIKKCNFYAIRSPYLHTLEYFIKNNTTKNN